MPEVAAVKRRLAGDADTLAPLVARYRKQQLRGVVIHHWRVLAQQHTAMIFRAHYCRRRVPEFSRCMLKVKAATVNPVIIEKASVRLTSETPSTP